MNQAPFESKTPNAIPKQKRSSAPRRLARTTLILQKQPVTVSELQAQMKCDLVTAYRNLSLLETENSALKLFRFDGTTLFVAKKTTPQIFLILKTSGEIQAITEGAQELHTELIAISKKLEARGYRNVTFLAEFFAEPPKRGPQR